MINPKTFGKRSTAYDRKKEPKIRYFLTFEGEETEVQYFSGVIQFKKELGINNLFKIIPLARNYEEKTWSHPCKFIIPLIRTLKEFSSGQISVESVVQHSVDHLCDKGLIDKNCQKNPSEFSDKLYEKLAESGYAKTDTVENQDEILACICEFSYEMFPEGYAGKLIDNLQQDLIDQMYYYDSESDRVCLIVDRDIQNFKPEQYDSLLSACKKRNFSLYVSNPSFELWLLMHFPEEMLELDPKDMLENKKHSQNRRYLGFELGRLLHGYSKNNVQFENFIDNVDAAIQHEQNYCEDVVRLKEKLGSNVGLLIKELKK